jgi:hypothetical protein
VKVELAETPYENCAQDAVDNVAGIEADENASELGFIGGLKL